MRAALRRARGFTLIELLVVMAIIATLLSIAAPRYFDHLDRTRENSLRQTLAVMRDAIDKYAADTGHFPETLDVLVDKRYLRAIPEDPITESVATWVVEPPPDDPLAGVWNVRSGAGEPYGNW
ncbi:type II secretion system protein [Denitromonas iodatirespirans]|uniref:Type II secretion system protein n=1 Tax=Denitromonas iodatirespirans TaxID=2795389 RepID=A0A944DH17_DENI1|nr:type II secretion system protein [Denitromonas iodatirespirans]MBT0962718.1 type II secretion system protein [Denitromonas iodatirespirans]